MPIDSIKLMGLFNDEQFREWMLTHFPKGLQAIDQAKSAGLPQPAVQAQVVTLYNKIYQSSLIDEFKGFISKHYPHVMADEDVEIPLAARLMVPAAPDKNGIFSSYNPNLLRFPMQMMFRSDDAAELKQAVEMFASRFRRSSKSLIMGDIGYIEYVPPNLMQYLDKIPESNWEILANRK